MEVVLHTKELDEGDTCPECGADTLRYKPVENCSCHINPPCSACVDNKLVCPKCGYTEGDRLW